MCHLAGTAAPAPPLCGPLRPSASSAVRKAVVPADLGAALLAGSRAAVVLWQGATGCILRMTPDETQEWLEADGIGGFASGTASGPRTRRYHALLLVATAPPTGRMVLVNGFDAWVETPNGQYAISTQRYTPETIYPDGVKHCESFGIDPW